MAFIDERPKERLFNIGSQVNLGKHGIGKVISYQGNRVSVLTDAGSIFSFDEKELVPVE